MTHQMAWVVPNTVLLATLHGAVPAEQVQIVADHMYQEMDSVVEPGLLHILIDIRGCSIKDKVWMYAKIDFKRHPNTGISIVIGDSRVGGMVVAIFSKILNLQIRYSETLESAIKILRDRDAIVNEYLNQKPLQE